MCGILGMAAFGGVLQDAGRLHAMAESLRHRGPDDSGARISPTCALGAERLRITDLRAEAAQPFADPTDRVWIAANGAIYNVTALRTRYASYPYTSHSDVEPLVPLYLDRGINGFEDIDGMFAVAIWDADAHRLILARDRAGEKPLFWRQVGEEIWFASEMQALLTNEARSIDGTAFVDYLHFGYVREPRTIFSGIHKVPAGTAIAFARGGPELHRYWNPRPTPADALDVDAATTALERTLVNAVEAQLAADVPVGVFTSGGVDSGLLAVLAARMLAPNRLRTFAVGFVDQRFDDLQPAAELARLCGSEHTEVIVDPSALRSAFDCATERIAEPIGDPALLPTMLLARHARHSVGVVLSGEGADELFGGYPTYIGHRLAPMYLHLPRLFRAGVTAALARLPVSNGKVTWDYLLRRFVEQVEMPVLPRHVAWFGTGLPGSLIAPAHRQELALEDSGSGDDLSRVMFFDYRTYLPDGLLTKIDRATMAVGLEARAPYLDRNVTKLAFDLPRSFKVRGLETKWLLKRVAQRYLPDGLVLRPKRGLSVPIASWINRELKDEVDRLLHPERLASGDLLDAHRVGALLTDHRAGRANHARGLWPLIVFERWRERWMGDA